MNWIKTTWQQLDDKLLLGAAVSRRELYKTAAAVLLISWLVDAVL